MSPLDEPVPPWCRRLIALADYDPGRATRLARLRLAAAEDPWPRFAYGWALLLWERLDAAGDALGAAREAFAARPQGRLGALLSDYGLLLLDQRRLARQGLDEELAAMAGRLAEAGDPRLAARARLDQARQLNVMGRPQASEAVLDLLERADPPPRPVTLARLARARAVAAYLRGEYPRALVLLSRAEARFRPARRRLELARCWLERAAAAVNQERLDETLDACRRAERAFAAFGLPLQRAFCLKIAGVAATRQGQYGQAIGQTRRALDLFHELGRAHDVGACTLNLGNIYFHSGSWAAALAAYARAEEHFVAAGMVSHQLLVRRNRAMVYRASGRPAEAVALLDDLERQAAALGFQAEVAEIWAVQAALLADEGRAAEATRRYGEAHDRFAQLENLSAAAECRLELGWVALRAGDPPAAAAHFAAAGPGLAGRDHHAWRVRYGQARCAQLAGDTPTALRHYLAAGATVAALRRRLASERLSSDLYAQARRLHADALLLAVERGDALAALTFAEGQRALTLQQLMAGQAAAASPDDQAAHEELRLRIEALVAKDQPGAALDAALERYDQLLLRIRHGGPTAALEAPAPEGALDLDGLRRALCAALGRGWTALAYTILDDRLITVSLTPGELGVDSQPYDAPLRRLLDRASLPAYRYYTYRDVPFAQGLAPRPWDAQTTLAERLIPARVRPRLGPDHRLLILPAGPLHLLPWGALRLDDGWLAERAVVQLLPSLTLAPALFRPGALAGRALAVGCGSFQGRDAELPAVAAELAAVAEGWPGPCERRFEEAATRAAVLAAPAEAPGGLALLHLASHAQLLASRGLAAHVKLWDGNLLLPEIAGLDLRGALVVLSACDGAAADVLPGEEVLSLTWAFLAGGARAVVASLWPLSDQLAPAIMVLFYRELRGGSDPARALARAQRALIGGGGELSEPQVWAALQLVGGSAGGAWGQAPPRPA